MLLEETLKNQPFAQYIIAHHIIQFGDFTLKSGRKSPYFINFGNFDSGEKIALLGNYYAQHIKDNQIDCEVIFGTAYKAIPMAIATAIQLKKEFCFNRKETKNHGDKGITVGADLTGKKVAMLDDVITSGGTIQEAHQIVQACQGHLTHVILAMDRQEVFAGTQTAIDKVSQELPIQISSITNISTVIHCLKEMGSAHYQIMMDYFLQYGKGNSCAR